MRNYWQLLGTVGVVVVALASLVVVERGLFGTTDATLISLDKAPATVEVRSGETLRQSLELTPGEWVAITLYAYAENQISGDVRLTIRDEAGAVLRTSTARRARYEAEDRLVRFDIPIKKLQVTQRRPVTLEVTSTQAIAWRASSDERDIYKAGTAQVNAQDISRDLAVGGQVAAPLAIGVVQGLRAAAVFILGLVLISFLPLKWQWWGMAALLVGCTPLVLLGYWYSDNRLGIADWDYYFSLHHYYRATIVVHHQLPLWNPYTCGGTAALADPEFPVFTPTFLLELLLGIPTGLRLATWLATATGALGMLLLAKRLSLSVWAGGLAAVIAFFGTVNLLEITEGHVNVFAAGWIPWILWAWLNAYRQHSARNYFITAFFLALTFYQGGIYLLAYTGLVFTGLVVLAPRRRAAIRAGVVSGLFALSLAAFKLVPVGLWLWQFPDEAYAGSTTTWPWLFDILFGRHLHGTYLIFGQSSGWHEYGAYIGYFVLGLVLVGILSTWRNRIVQALALTALLTLALSSLGPTLAPLFDVLWFFPRSNISRIILCAIIAIALLAAYGLDYIRSRAGKHTWVVIALAGMVVADLFSLSYRVSEQAFVLPDVRVAPSSAPAPLAFTTDRFEVAGQDKHTRAYAAARQGYGVMAYCSVLGPDPRPVTIHDEGGDSYLALSQGSGTAKVLFWSPNSVVVQINTNDGAVVALNTNYVSGWAASTGEIVQVDGRVAVQVGPGEHIVTLRYQAPGMKEGALITIATIGLALVWLRRKHIAHTH